MHHFSTGPSGLWILGGTCRKDRPFRPLPQHERTFYTSCMEQAFPHGNAPFHTLSAGGKAGSTTREMTAVAQALATAPVPPQNLDAEESVLGAMMLSPLAIGAVT